MFQVRRLTPTVWYSVSGHSQFGDRLAEHVHRERHGGQRAYAHQRPSSGTSLVVGELVGDQQTDAHT
jgi:hypothetical protein